ncbi:MAG TPA: hypothetical protein VG934_03500 [Candidatus Paceibacterota bacterium]|nr:hypothetical protein [Candidatus Paceibacterota bacterium]
MTQVKSAPSEDFFPVARDMAVEAKQFLDNLHKDNDQEYFDRLKTFGRRLDKLTGSDLGHRLQRVLNSTSHKKVSAETLALNYYATGLRSAQQKNRVERLLQALISLPLNWHPQNTRHYA